MRHLSTFVWVGLIAACSVDNGGTSLQIVDTPLPDDSCILRPDASVVSSSGMYDPHGDAGLVPGSFDIGIRLTNNMIIPTNDPATSFTRSVRANVNDVVLLGFNVCWDLASRHQNYGSADDGMPFDCGKLPAAQSAFVPSTGTVPANAGKAVVFVSVLTADALRAPDIFGPDFYPADLPERVRAVVSNPQPPFSLPLANGACEQDPTTHECAATRDHNWGNFPETPDDTATMLIEMRAVGKTQGGLSILSNWFLYSVDVCVGCLARSCGVPQRADCTDGSSSYVGGIVDFTASCQPFQFHGRKCLALACP